MAESHMFPAIGLLEQRFSEEIETFPFFVRVCFAQSSLLVPSKTPLVLGAFGLEVEAEALKVTGLPVF